MKRSSENTKLLLTCAKLCLTPQVDRIRFCPAKAGKSTFGWMEWESTEVALSIIAHMHATVKQQKSDGVRPLIHHAEMSGRPMLKGLHAQVWSTELSLKGPLYAAGKLSLQGNVRTPRSLQSERSDAFCWQYPHQQHYIML